MFRKYVTYFEELLSVELNERDPDIIHPSSRANLKMPPCFQLHFNKIRPLSQL